MRPWVGQNPALCRTKSSFKFRTNSNPNCRTNSVSPFWFLLEEIFLLVFWFLFRYLESLGYTTLNRSALKEIKSSLQHLLAAHLMSWMQGPFVILMSASRELTLQRMTKLKSCSVGRIRSFWFRIPFFFDLIALLFSLHLLSILSLYLSPGLCPFLGSV